MHKYLVHFLSKASIDIYLAFVLKSGVEVAGNRPFQLISCFLFRFIVCPLQIGLTLGWYSILLIIKLIDPSGASLLRAFVYIVGGKHVIL